MKIALSFLSLVVILSGCVSRTDPGKQSRPETPEREKARPEPGVAPAESGALFPRIEASYGKASLRCIEAYCAQRGIRALERDRVRLFLQPMGVVAGAVEVDLAHRGLTVYPGTHGSEAAVRTVLGEEQVEQLRALVTSPAFVRITAENAKIGMDGTSYLVEVWIGDDYSWKLHWAPDDRDLLTVIRQILSLTGKNSP